MIEKEINASSVQEQLERILANPKFTTSPQLSNFLKYVVAETLQGRADQIKQYTVGVHGLGRPASFNPQTDTIVRIQARQLRRALKTYYEEWGSEDPIRIDIPKGTYVPNFQTLPSKKAFDSISIPIIAVVPLVNLSTQPDDACIADGLTEELTIALNRFVELQVIGPLNRLRGTQVGPRQIGADYGVRFVLQGTVRRRGSKLRISPTLSETSSGNLLWGETYEFNLDEVSLFEIEDLVTSQIVATVADSFGVIFRELYPETRHEHLHEPSVTDAVLKYNYARITVNPKDMAIANQAIQKILDDQPDNPLMLAMLAGNYYLDAVMEFGMVPQSREKAEELVVSLEKALGDVKMLSGLLPICAGCKKIRDDKGYWNRIETYISEHSEAMFSHGLCPDCAKELYPDLYKELHPDLRNND